jgi:hypothetical protein
MGERALIGRTKRTHLIGDVPALGIVGLALLALVPQTSTGSMESFTQAG